MFFVSCVFFCFIHTVNNITLGSRARLSAVISRAVAECTLLIELMFNTMCSRQSEITLARLAIRVKSEHHVLGGTLVCLRIPNYGYHPSRHRITSAQWVTGWAVMSRSRDWKSLRRRLVRVFRTVHTFIRGDIFTGRCLHWKFVYSHRWRRSWHNDIFPWDGCVLALGHNMSTWTIDWWFLC